MTPNSDTEMTRIHGVLVPRHCTSVFLSSSFLDESDPARAVQAREILDIPAATRACVPAPPHVVSIPKEAEGSWPDHLRMPTIGIRNMCVLGSSMAL